MDRGQWTTFGIGVLAGAVVGGAVALIFAPKSGKDTRAYIKEKVGDKIGSIRHKMGEKISGEECTSAGEKENG